MKQGCCGITRRGFLLGTGAGLAVGAPVGWYALKGRRHAASPPHSDASMGMPGPYPGRVIEVHHPQSVTPTGDVNDQAVNTMMNRGMTSLTGADDPAEAWRQLFQRDDVVAIKVNPVGKRTSSRPRAAGSISSPAVLLDIVRNLKDIGVPTRNIIVFERYANEFRSAGYERVMGTRPMDGVRWYASAHAYDNEQLEITGQNLGGNRDPHVVGYDRDVFVHMGFCSPSHHRRDDRRFRSHLSRIVTHMANKIITIPCLKDHRSAGVTLALKNMSHGFNNNVARSHISGIYRLDDSPTGPNQCNTFIPTAVTQRHIRERATLHIMDGLIGVYEGGPGNWNRTWATWQRKSLFFATDPVAMDHVGWDIIDAKRALEGWGPVGQMGLHHQSQPQRMSPRLASLAAMGMPETALLTANEHHDRPDGRNSEVFDRRQPEHIVLAGLNGLGRFNANEIDYRRLVVRS